MSTPRERFAEKMGQMGMEKGLGQKKVAPASKSKKKGKKPGKFLKKFKAGYSQK